MLAVLGVFFDGCGANRTVGPDTARYTCGQLAVDFHRSGDAPADRAQAITDAMVRQVKDPGQASANIRDVVVYSLTSACAGRAASWHPVASALRAAQRIFRPA